MTNEWKNQPAVIIKDTWRTRFKQATGYMPRPKPVKIHPDRKKKKVMIKVLYNNGWGSKQLAIWFKTSQRNVCRWSQIPTPEAMQEFERQFQLAMKDYDNKALFVVKERMMEIIPEETNLQRLVSAGQFFKGTTGPKTLVQNNIYGDLVKKYAPQGIETEK
jgi:hypothetical protein